MSNTDAILREANELLETAQKEVLKEINSQGSGILRFFIKKKTDSLKQAQSAISKAINQMRNLVKDEAAVIAKLQNHINEKTSQAKKLEESNTIAQKEISELRDKIKFYEDQLQRVAPSSESAVAAKPVEARPMPHLEEEFKTKLKELEERNTSLQERFKASKDDLAKSQQLSVELSKRIKRIKAEVTNN